MATATENLRENPRTDSSTVQARPGVSRRPMPVIRYGGRGGTAWSLPMADQMKTQPQDGAVSSVSQMMRISSHLHSNALDEPEDARLTGGTRTLTRRLLGLNVGVVGAAARKGPSPVARGQRVNEAQGDLPASA